MADGRRQTCHGRFYERGELIMPMEYPLLGSSIGRSKKLHGPSGTGTLGGYISVDGEIMAITNHHVVFGAFRMEAYPSAKEETDKTTYTILQPSENDLDAQIERLNFRMGRLKEDEKGPTAYGNEKEEMAEVTSELRDLGKWTHEKSIIGSVWNSSGIRVREVDKPGRFRMDWALLKLNNASRFTEPNKFSNEVTQFATCLWTT